MNWYGHRYLGPGNKLKNGEPVDEDDEIARIHDNLYDRAKTEEDIREADRDAIKHFWELQSPHGYLGAAGLAAKYGVESLTGVLYPNMKRRQPTPAQLEQRKRYAQIQRQLADTSRETGLSFREIQQAHSKDAWDELKRNQPGTSKYVQQEQQEEQIQQPDSSQGSDNSLLGLFNDIEGMEFDVPSINGVNDNQVLAASGPSGASGRSSGSHTVGHIVTIPRPLAPKPSIVTFRKNRIFFSYGICTKRINNNSDDYYTTPLALIPTDLVGFYLSPTEFRELPNNAWAKECRVKVTPLGIRTAFEFGGTTSGHTTNEFVPIGLVSVGLNVNTEIVNCTYGTMDNMKPNNMSLINASDIINKYYRADDSHTNLVTRHTVGYAAFVSPGPTTGATVFTNNHGQMRKDQFVDQFLINTAIGKPVVNYTYKCKHAPISAPYYNPPNVHTRYVHYGGPRTRAFALEVIKNGDHSTTLGAAHTTDISDKINDYNTTPVTNVEQFLEKGGHNFQNGGFPFKAQPQIHIGIQAVPAMTPGSDSTTFQNTSAYWAVEAELDVELHHGSYYSENGTVQFPSDTTIWVGNRAYNGYCQLSGLVAMPAPEPPATRSTQTEDFTPPNPPRGAQYKMAYRDDERMGPVRRNLGNKFDRLSNMGQDTVN